MKYALLALLMTGCAAKQRVPMKPEKHILTGCREVSVNVKTDEVTVVCPLHEGGK